MSAQVEHASSHPVYAIRENDYPWLGNALDKVITPAQKAKIRGVLSIGGGPYGSEGVALRKWIGKSKPVTVVDLQPADYVSDALHQKHGIRYIQADWFNTVTDESNTLLTDSDLIICRHPPIEAGRPVNYYQQGQLRQALEVTLQDKDFFYRLVGLADTISRTRSPIPQHLVITTWNSMPDTLLKAQLARERVPTQRVVFNGGKVHKLNIAGIPSEVQEDHYLLHVQSRR